MMSYPDSVVRDLGNSGSNCRRSENQRQIEHITRQLRHDVAVGRVDKYALRDAIQYRLAQYDAARPSGEKIWKNIRLCGTPLRPDELSAAVARNGKVYQTNVSHCDSVWLCPVCTTKIQSQRAQSIGDLIAVANVMGYRVGMITYTAHHSHSDSLSDIVSRFYTAHRSVQKTRLTRKIRAEAGILGVVRVAEVTRSLSNGWHWHYHVLIIFKNFFDAKALKKQWISALERNGFIHDDESRANAERHSFKFDVMRKGGDERKLAYYVNKMAFELSYSVKKQGRGRESLTPWDLAARSFTADTEQERKMCASLFEEYAKTTKGRKQLTMTPGLRKNFGFDESAGLESVQMSEIKWGLTSEHINAMRKAHKVRVYLQEVAVRGLEELGRYDADADGRIAPPAAVVSFFRRLGCSSEVADNVTTWESYLRYRQKMHDMGSGEERRRADVARLGRSALSYWEQHDKYAERKYSNYLHARHAGASTSLLGDMLREMPLKSDRAMRIADIVDDTVADI